MSPVFSNCHTNNQAATSKRARNRLAMIMASLAVAGVASLALVPPAAAAGGCQEGNFCAFRHVNYNDMLLSSAAGRGSDRVEVADDQVSSASNMTGNSWEGVTERTRLPDEVVFRFAPHTDVARLNSGANDKIDHFNVR